MGDVRRWLPRRPRTSGAYPPHSAALSIWAQDAATGASTKSPIAPVSPVRRLMIEATYPLSRPASSNAAPRHHAGSGPPQDRTRKEPTPGRRPARHRPARHGAPRALLARRLTLNRTKPYPNPRNQQARGRRPSRPPSPTPVPAVRPCAPAPRTRNAATCRFSKAPSLGSTCRHQECRTQIR